MADPSFLWSVGSLLGCSIALAIVVKYLSGGFAASGNKPYIYGIVAGILTSGAAYLTTLISNNPFEIFWFLGGVFLLFGIIHIFFVHNRYFSAYKRDNKGVLWAEILFGLSIILFTAVVFSSLQQFFHKGEFLFYPVLMSALLFFVPLLLFHSFQAAYAIPATRFPTWQYPLHQPIILPDIDDRPNEEIVVIGFEIAKRPTDYRRTYFRAKGPETMKLGDFFYHFINEYNDRFSDTTIDYVDKNKFEPYEWWFRWRPKWYQFQKIFNPELSMRENGIKENTIIICERVIVPMES